MNASQPLLLLVEDNEDDIFIFTRLCGKIGVTYQLHTARNGVEAMHYLAGNGEFADREKFPLPKLVVLDLKLPLQPGLEVLAWMRLRPELATIPVTVLSSSAELRDIARANRLRASAYLVKPPTRETLAQLFTELQTTAGTDIPHFAVEGNRLIKAPLLG